MTASNYNCSQSELYTTCRNAWLLCQQYLLLFTDYKSKYTAAFIAENLALIKIVEAMDDNDARLAPVKDLRKDLMNEKTDVTSFYTRLKGYVMEAFKDDKTTLDAMYTEMGQAYYEKINSGTWTEVSGLLSAMIPFVKTHLVLLTEKGYMPATFLARLEEKETSFKTAHESWKGEYKAKPNATEAKIIANNDLKTKLMAMLADGQAVFCDNKPLAQKFVWTTLLAPVRGAKPTGLGGKITDKNTEATPLSIVTATIESLNLTVVCDKDGRYQFALPSADKYTIIFKAEGYKTLVVTDKEVKAGVMGRLNIVLEAL